METNIIIEKANLNDLEEILLLQKEAYIQEAKIYNDFNIQPLTQNIDSLILDWHQGVVIKAVKDGQIIGSVRAVSENNVCKIGKLIVKPDFQNQGIGKSLIKEIEVHFNNCFTFELFTGSKSIKNLSLYRKLGYKDFKTEQITNNLDLIYLQKENNGSIQIVVGKFLKTNT